MAAIFFVRQNGNEAGPMTADDLIVKAASGEIRPDAMVRKGPIGNWVVANSISSLVFPVTHSAMPPVMPANSTSVPSSNSASPLADSGEPKLIPCKDCGVMVSREALACPQCGGPFRATFVRIEPYAQPSQKHHEPYRRLEQLSAGFWFLAYVQLIIGIVVAVGGGNLLIAVTSITSSFGLFIVLLAVSELITLATDVAGHAREIRDLLVRRP